MGMDVFGIEPAADAGRYFRVTLWEWLPLLERMKALCSDFLNKELIAAMAFNEGAGPQDQPTCTKIADRLERWLQADSCAEYRLAVNASTLQIAPDGRLVSCEELSADAARASKSPFSIDCSEIAEFVAFLRNCGGFSVW